MSDETERRIPTFLPSSPLNNLTQRSRLLREIRDFFYARSFIEVETPVISADTVVDRHLDPIPVRIHQVDRWLQTSPEFAMKRLLVAGMEAIFQITRAFRDNELGPLHNPEFTMLEWYQVGQTYSEAIDFLDELCSTLLGRCRAERLTYRDAFRKYANVDPMEASLEELKTAAVATKAAIPSSMPKTDRDEWLNLLLAEVVERRLGISAPTILYDYPISQAALASQSATDPAAAQRFELYVDGIELANGYHELVDSAELLKRNHKVNQQRLADGKPGLPEKSHMLQAMEHGLPACSGVALGVDRLFMVRIGATHISEVIPFPFDRA